MPEKQFEEVVEKLNDLRNIRDEMVFIGGNYEKDEDKFNALKQSIKRVGFIPVIAKEVFEDVDPSEIHDESLRLLHNCGYAVIDITNPAGQLMELERARDYGVVTFVPYSSRHSSKMPVSLSKVMEGWGLGYLFKYDKTDGLKNFVESILLINHSKGKSPKDIIREIIGGKKPEKLILITSIGVLGKEVDNKDKLKELQKSLRQFNKKVIITGWDYETRGKDESTKYGVELIACEGGCTLYDTTGTVKKDFCEDSLRLVKRANRCVMYAINEYRKEKGSEQIVFFSQADEKSICYYLNPPEDIRKELDNNREENHTLPKDKDFAEKVKDKCRTSPTQNNNKDKVEYEKPKDTQAEEALLYAIEKVNAIDRTFHPYSIIIEEDTITVDLDPDRSYKEFTYRDIENIVQMAFAKMKDCYEQWYTKNYEQLHTRVLPQKDICIDILCKSKDEILIPLLEELVDDEGDTLVIYLSKGTESDIPMIFKGYSSGYNFIGIGDENISDRLKRAGVIPSGKTTAEVIGNILTVSKRS